MNSRISPAVPRPSLTLRRLSVLVLTAATLAATAVPDSAHAQASTASANKRYDIPAGPLDATLNRFALTAGVLLPFQPADAQGLNSPGLRGEFSVGEGFNRLLAGTGLRAVPRGGNEYRLENAAAPDISRLPTVQVAGDVVEDARGRVEGFVAQRTASGSKTDTPIVEIPQTINVVTADEVAARGAISLSQALRYTPGVSNRGYTESYMLADETTSRGFSPSPQYLDGSYLPYAGSLGGASQIEPYSLERIEVLKGPASVLYGQNQPGGIVNMVTKKPTDTPVREVKLGLGSYGRVNGALDVGGVINEDRSLLYRLVAVANTGDQQIDATKGQRLFIAPSLTWRPSAATSITAYLQLQRDDAVQDYQALPHIGSLLPGPGGQRISRDFFGGDPNYNDFYREQQILGVDWSHRFSDSLQFRQGLRFVNVNDRYKGFYLSAFASGAGGQSDYSRALRTKIDWQQHNTVLSLDNNLEWRSASGPVQHTVLAGVDYRRFDRRYDGYNAYSVTAIDLYNPRYDLATADPVLTTNWHDTVDQVGFYLQDQMRWRDLILTVGGRHDWAGIHNRDQFANTQTEQNHSAFTGRAGLTWLAGGGWAPYVSYSESFVPIVGTDFYGSTFKPTTGEQIELGVKFQPPGTRALASFSVFDIRQKNLTTTDYAHPGFSVQEGEVRSQGAELEIKARVFDNIDVIAAVSRADVRTTKSNNAASLNKQAVFSPPWSASLWANYRLPDGALKGLDIGLGARWTGSKYGDSGNTFRTPAYTVFDAALRYDLGEINAGWRGAELTLNVQNLFDKEYISNCNYSLVATTARNARWRQG
ncbi:TonB-dependent siderophore receptor [Pigmentiphaga aceris]|uniref:TonB-dependent siderophore receptor n=1 Tax=Pigmentiphaga aceris TaxID=1940612 RepID=UPI001CA3177E|nr:TonB-dependent siderophore receptor [Pigmentiphaga aceris]